MQRFIIDAEADGLYGALLTVAVVVTDCDGKEIDRFYGGLPQHIKAVKDPWVKEHVLSVLGDYQVFESEEALLQAVWQLWLTYHQTAICYADVPFPVETALFHKMVSQFSHNSMIESPFPMIDIASLLLANGLAPDTPRQDLVDCEQLEGALHNALFDVQLSNLLLNRFLPR